jgi:3-hydroxybutyryl-CoA dehydrogenase
VHVKTVGIISASAIGRGIAYIAAVAGYRVVLEDVSTSRLEEGVSYIKHTLEEDVARG